MKRHQEEWDTFCFYWLVFLQFCRKYSNNCSIVYSNPHLCTCSGKEWQVWVKSEHTTSHLYIGWIIGYFWPSYSSRSLIIFCSNFDRITPFDSNCLLNAGAWCYLRTAGLCLPYWVLIAIKHFSNFFTFHKDLLKYHIFMCKMDGIVQNRIAKTTLFSIAFIRSLEW